MPNASHIVKTLVLVVAITILPAQAQTPAPDLSVVPGDLSDGPNQIPTMCVLYHLGSQAYDPLWITNIGQMAEGPNGDLFGTSPNGGKYNRGTIFRISRDGKFKVVHDFNFFDGSAPLSGLTRGWDGNFYGTTYEGGSRGTGTIFKANSEGNVTTLFSFKNGFIARKLKPGEEYTKQEILDAAGSYPTSGPVQLVGDMLYGVTSFSNNQKLGILYQSGTSPESYHAVEKFEKNKGTYASSLSAGVDSKLYGVAFNGKNGDQNGMLFTANGGISPIHYFGYKEGSGPISIMQASDKMLYGTTVRGGLGASPGSGVLYRMNTDGSQYKVLHYFGPATGLNPHSRLTEAWDGKLYGTARYGSKLGRGVIFRIAKDGTNFEVVHEFTFQKTGRSPMSPLLLHSDGNLYGNTYQGGKHDKGVIYKLNPGYNEIPEAKDPGSRWCCSLGQNKGKYSGGALDPAALSGHKYGTIEKGDPVGYVYTTHGGMVDIGHVRDMADLTKYIYDLLIARYQGFALREGDVHIVKPPTDYLDALEMAGAIAYVEGWAHELITFDTWFAFKEKYTWEQVINGDVLDFPQDFSSFSPEDLTSNIVGIELAKRAITNGCFKDFEKAIDEEMLTMMKDLGARAQSVTAEKFKTIAGSQLDRWGKAEGKWFVEDFAWETLLRRNFDGRIWTIPAYDVQSYDPYWLNPGWFLKYYDRFTYTIKKEVNGKKGVTLQTMNAETQALRTKWLKDHPNRDR